MNKKKLMLSDFVEMFASYLFYQAVIQEFGKDLFKEKKSKKGERKR